MKNETTVKQIVHLGFVINGERFIPKNWNKFKTTVDEMVTQSVPEEYRGDVGINFIVSDTPKKRWFDPKMSSLIEISYRRPETVEEESKRVKLAGEELQAKYDRDEKFEKDFIGYKKGLMRPMNTAPRYSDLFCRDSLKEEGQVDIEEFKPIRNAFKAFISKLRVFINAN